eukprot:6471629-Amphidinium_carterae.4
MEASHRCTGHKEALHCALRFLATRGVYVTSTILGFTTADYVTKHKSDYAFADVVTRAEIAELVLADGAQPVSPIQVDHTGYSSAEALAQAHATPGSVPLFLVGSDLCKRPYKQTLVVTRTTLELEKGHGQEFYDIANASGRCLQRQTLNVSSTRVRNALNQKRMPRLYSAEAQSVIRRTLGWRLRTAEEQAARLASASALISAPQLPPGLQNQKPPEKQNLGRVHEASTAPATEVATLRKNERRSTVRLAPRDGSSWLVCTTNERDLDNRPPLKRRRTRLSSSVASVPPLPDIAVPVAANAHVLLQAGTMKLQPPHLVNLNQYWSMVATTLCSLLHVQPLTIARRGSEGTIRVAYEPLPPSIAVPEIRFATPIDIDELDRNLRQVSNEFIFCACLSFDLVGMETRDFDPDTARGDALRATLIGAILNAAKNAMICTVHVAFILFQEAQLIVFVKPLYITTAVAMAQEVLESVVITVGKHKARNPSVASNLQVLVNPDRTTYLTGGMRKRPKPEDVTSSGHSILFVPGDQVYDALMHCIRWVLSREGWASDHTAEATHLHLRTVAQAWLRNANKQHWMCAGQLVPCLADDMDCSTDEFLDVRCSPLSLAAPAYVIVYAISCLYQVQMFVLDRAGRRADGYVIASGWGLQWHSSTWVVTSAFTQRSQRVEPEACIVISPTQPAGDQGVRSETLFDIVHGAGRSERSASPSDSPAAKRKKTEGTSADQAGVEERPCIFFPEWMPQELNAESQVLYVSYSDAPPCTITVPITWSIPMIESQIAAHVGAKQEWVDFTWAFPDVAIDYAKTYVDLDSDASTDLAQLVQSVDIAHHAPASGPSAPKVVLGLSDLLQQGLSKFTRLHPDFSKSLASTVSTLLPNENFNAIELWSATLQQPAVHLVARPGSHVIVIPQQRLASSWMWIENSTGTDSVCIRGARKTGSWLPFNKALHCRAPMACQLQVEDSVHSVVIYTSKHLPSQEQQQLLSCAGFPAACNSRPDKIIGAADSSVCGSGINVGRSPVGAVSMHADPKLPVHGKRAPIGASSVKKSINAPITAYTTPTVSFPPAAATSATQTFENWVRDKLETLELQQAEILQLLKRRSSNPAVTDAPWRITQGGVRRLRSVPCAFDILFRPQSDQSQDSLFACLLACAKLEPSFINIHRLRRSVKQVLQQFHADNVLVADLSLEDWVGPAASIPDFIFSTDSAQPRPGTVLDFLLGSALLAVRAVLIDNDGRSISQVGEFSPSVALMFDDDQFIVITTPADTHLRGRPSQVYIPDHIEVLAPMTDKLVAHIRRMRGSRDAYVEQSFRAVFSQRLDTIMMFALVVPASMSVLASNLAARIHVKINQVVMDIQLPSWCSFAHSAFLASAPDNYTITLVDDIVSAAEEITLRAYMDLAVGVLNSRDRGSRIYDGVRQACLGSIHLDRRSALGILPFLPFECTNSSAHVSFPEYRRALATTDLPFRLAYYTCEDVGTWRRSQAGSASIQTLQPAIVIPEQCAESLCALLCEACSSEVTRLAIPSEQQPAPVHVVEPSGERVKVCAKTVKRKCSTSRSRALLGSTRRLLQHSRSKVARARGRMLLASVRSRRQIQQSIYAPTLVDIPLLEGGATSSSLWKRCLAARKQQGVPGKQSGRPVKSIVIAGGKAKPVTLTYTRSISSREVIAMYAAEKRIGRQYLSLRIPSRINPRSVSYSDTPVYANWAGRTLNITNTRYAALSRPSIEERRRLEIDTDEMVDMCRLKESGNPSQDIDSIPIAIQKCAERLVDGIPDKKPKSSLRPKMMVRHSSSLQSSSSCSRPAQSNVAEASTPPPTVKMHLDCNITVPRTWTLGEALHSVRHALRADRCALSVSPGCLTVQLTVDTTEGVTFVQGAGKSFRVQHDSVAKTALSLVTSDLHSMQNLQISATLLRFVLTNDRKCALATFQARSPHQRLQALAAALNRMGLSDKALDLTAWAEQHSSNLPSPPAMRDPDIEAVRKGAAGTREDAIEVGFPRDQLQPNMSERSVQLPLLLRRLEAVETWAHALDAQLETDPSTADRAAINARELLDSMAKQAMSDCIREQRSDLSDRILSLEQQVAKQEMSKADVVSDVQTAGSSMLTNSSLSSTDRADLDLVCNRLVDLEKQTQECKLLVASLQEIIDLKEYGQSDQMPNDKFMRLARAVAGTTQKAMRAEQLVGTLSSQVELLRKEVSRAATQSVDPQLMQLLQMHTRAISQTWQWVASNVRITQAHAAWIAPCLPTAPSPRTAGEARATSVTTANLHGMGAATDAGRPLAPANLEQSGIGIGSLPTQQVETLNIQPARDEPKNMDHAAGAITEDQSMVCQVVGDSAGVDALPIGAHTEQAVPGDADRVVSPERSTWEETPVVLSSDSDTE